MDLLDKAALIAEARNPAGARLKYLGFWSDRPRRPGGPVGAECFSQWYAAPFTGPSGETYPTAEHWMMAEKARLFADAAAEARIMKAASPGAAKALGRAVRGFRERDWEAARFDIVVAGNHLKFSQHAALERFLLGTGARILVEASPRDALWGAGLGKGDPAFEQPERWPGLNLLGFALMRVRRDLREAGRETRG